MSLNHFINLALAAAIAACLSMAWMLDAPSDMQALIDTARASTDAEQQAARDLRRDLAAARLCRELHGDSGYQWSAAGEVICIQRSGKRETQKVAAL